MNIYCCTLFSSILKFQKSNDKNGMREIHNLNSPWIMMSYEKYHETRFVSEQNYSFDTNSNPSTQIQINIVCWHENIWINQNKYIWINIKNCWKILSTVVCSASTTLLLTSSHLNTCFRISPLFSLHPFPVASHIFTSLLSTV